MARPPKFSVEMKQRIVLSVLRGELGVSEAARRSGASETSVSKWRDQFVEAGRRGLALTGEPRRSSREAQLQAQVDELTQALGEAHIELRVLRRGGAAAFPTPSWS